MLNCFCVTFHSQFYDRPEASVVSDVSLPAHTSHQNCQSNMRVNPGTRRCRTCDLVVEPEEEADLKKAIAESAIIKQAATADSPIYINYDHKLAGESATHPKQRVAPFKEHHLAKCLRAWMENRGGSQPEDPLHIADEYVLTDGGKPGLYKDLVKAFKQKQHDVKHVTMMYLRDDVKACHEKTKGGSVNQIEGKLHITQAITTQIPTQLYS